MNFWERLSTFFCHNGVDSLGLRTHSVVVCRGPRFSIRDVSDNTSPANVGFLRVVGRPSLRRGISFSADTDFRCVVRADCRGNFFLSFSRRGAATRWQTGSYCVQNRKRADSLRIATHTSYVPLISFSFAESPSFILRRRDTARTKRTTRRQKLYHNTTRLS